MELGRGPGPREQHGPLGEERSRALGLVDELSSRVSELDLQLQETRQEVSMEAQPHMNTRAHILYTRHAHTFLPTHSLTYMHAHTHTRNAITRLL